MVRQSYYSYENISCRYVSQLKLVEKKASVGEIRVENGKQSQGTPCFFYYFTPISLSYTY
jgi:hypothetical protein